MIVPILVLVIALSTIFYMANYFNQDKKKIVLAKGLTSLQFVILGVYCATLKGCKTDRIMLILVGLFCGLIGDILFGLKYIFIDRKKELYIGGILFFFTGHIAYILSFFDVVPLPLNFLFLHLDNLFFSVLKVLRQRYCIRLVLFFLNLNKHFQQHFQNV